MQAIDSPNFHRYQSMEALRSFLGQVEDVENKGPDSYYDNVCNNAFTGIRDADMHYDENSRLSYLSVSVINAMNQLLSNQLEI